MEGRRYFDIRFFCVSEHVVTYAHEGTLKENAERVYLTMNMVLPQKLKEVFLCIAAMAVLISLTVPAYAQADTDPPEISSVDVVEVSETSATITWTTNEDADSLVNYGLQEDYGIIRQPEADRTSHTITLENLEPGRTYYFRVVSSDEEGNQGISADYQLQTVGASQEQGSGSGSGEGAGEAPNVGDGQTESQNDAETQEQITEEVIEKIQQITSEQQLQEIINEVVKAVEGITEDLTIVGPPTVIPETTTAIVRWTTDRPADSRVLFSPANEYIVDQYSFSQASTQGPVTEHEVQLIGLEPFTEYHFKVESTDSYGITGASRDYTFKTKASLPEIRNLRILKVEENSATIAWDTAAPAKATIEYQDLTTGAQNSIGRPTLQTSHQMKISDLTLGTRYVAFVIAENAGGDRVKSNPLTFVTVRDVEPPIISNVTNESTLFPGGEGRIQTIIEWLTDEPALCTMQYREGVAIGADPITVESEDQSHKERHVEVIVDFAPATVYQFWLNCVDEAGNAVDSENFVLFTPIQEKNIIDIIIENFEATFGWVKNITN